MKRTRLSDILPVLLITISLFSLIFSFNIGKASINNIQEAEPDEIDGGSGNNYGNETRAEDFQYLGTRNLDGTTQYGSVYMRYFKEYWVKQSWSSSTIHRYNDAGRLVGTRNTVSRSIALGTDSDGNLYVGDNSRTFYKFDRNGNQLWARTYNDGSQARGITCDDKYVYGLFNYGPILKLDKNTGAKLGTINPSLRFSNAFGMLYFNNMLIVSDSDHELLVYDMNGQHLRTIDPPYNSGNYGLAWTGRELQACEFSRNTWYRYSAVDLLVYTDSAALVVPKGEENVCYTRYKPYTFSVNLTTNENLNHVSELKVYLDYNTTNATLGYNWSRNEFFKLQDEKNDVNLLIDNCTLADDGVDRIWVNFSVIFNFSFPHERPIDCLTKTSSVANEHTMDRFPWLFRVENDFEFAGTPFFSGEEQGKIDPGDWVKGGQNITVSNLSVVYAGSPMLYPDDEFFNVRITDRFGNTWWDNSSSVEGISLPIRTRYATDPDEEYLITIEDIPGSGICMTNLSFPVKLDAEPPLFPVNLKCRAGGFKDKETGNTKQPEMYVTWDAVEDPASGLLGYYYSQSDNSGTTDGTFTNVTEVKIDELEEGYAEIYVWCVDNVGNIGDAASSGILVDLSPPVFSNHTPLDGSWHNHTDIDCSIEIFDGPGSGVDGSTIEYSISASGTHGFNFWMPAWVPEEGNPIIPSVKYIFPEGEENYIKWRAKDISENGFSESPPVNIKVDITPVSFNDEITPQIEWYAQNTISTTITVSDTGSGVDLESLEARISTAGPNDFGKWISIDAENIHEPVEGQYEITVTFSYAEGKDNYIMFRGTDMVGTPYTLSDKFNLKIDSSPVYFGTFKPDEEEYADDRTVECFIQILDDGSGVNPSTVQYSIGYGGTDNESFDPWKNAVNVVTGNPTQVLMKLEFEWGDDNYIKWRADDLTGTGFNESMPYRVWVNSIPKVVISSPDDGSYFRFDGEITFDATHSSDEDGDNLTHYWTSNVSANRQIGSGAYFSFQLEPGKHTITLFVSDGHGYNESEKIRIEVGGPAVYGKDSDGDGFSDGLEREKGSDPYNRAVFPGGKPDIVDQDRGGILGEDSSLLFVIVGCILLLIIVILVILFIIRKRKKKDSEQISPSGMPIPMQSQYGPPQHPYPQGQYHPTGLPQGYGEMAQYQGAAWGMQGAGAPGAVFPPGAGITNTNQYGPPVPGQAPQAQIPQNDYSPQLPPYSPAGPGPSGSTAYSLPLFSTEEGAQNLELMALPPGPDPAGGQAIMNPAAAPSIHNPDLSLQPEAVQAIGALDTLPTPPEPFQPASLQAHEGIPAPVTNEITMQCHSCGNNYNAEISQYPALVTCPVCKTQGIIESQ